MTKVLILGGTGMLGSLVVDYLSRRSDLQVAATARTAELAAACQRTLDRVGWRAFDVSRDGLAADAGVLGGCEWVINCIGIIKPLIRDDNGAEVERALRVNALFPMLLARATEGGARVLQIATDCVYSGSKGGHREDDGHDPTDVYGKTKSLGEVRAEHVHHLRCSIIGPEARKRKSLLEWLLGRPQGGEVNGFVNHAWNGLTTLHFAKLCEAVIVHGRELPRLQHLVPRGQVTKCELLELLAANFDRGDLTVKPTAAAVAVDRTLATDNQRLNRELWAMAGYPEPPSVGQMVEELAAFEYRWKPLSPAVDSGERHAGPECVRRSRPRR